jgi:hypothetical protein
MASTNDPNGLHIGDFSERCCWNKREITMAEPPQSADEGPQEPPKPVSMLDGLVKSKEKERRPAQRTRRMTDISP